MHSKVKFSTFFGHKRDAGMGHQRIPIGSLKTMLTYSANFNISKELSLKAETDSSVQF